MAQNPECKYGSHCDTWGCYLRNEFRRLASTEGYPSPKAVNTDNIDGGAFHDNKTFSEQGRHYMDLARSQDCREKTELVNDIERIRKEKLNQGEITG